MGLTVAYNTAHRPWPQLSEKKKKYTASAPRTATAPVFPLLEAAFPPAVVLVQLLYRRNVTVYSSRSFIYLHGL